MHDFNREFADADAAFAAEEDDIGMPDVLPPPNVPKMSALDRLDVLNADERARREADGSGSGLVPGTPAQVLADFNAIYTIVKEGARAFVLERMYDARRKRFFYDRLTFENFRQLHIAHTVMVQQGKNVVMQNAAEWWLRNPQHREFIKGTIFAPSGPVPAGMLNLWEGFAVEPRAGDWSLLREHMRTIICDGDDGAFAYLMGWLARLFQHPEAQGEVAVVMRGGEGAGKGTLPRALIRIIGQHALQIFNPSHLVGNFNAHLRDCLFLFADEAFFAGDKAHVGTLKSIVTETDITVEAKYQNAVSVPNFLHLMMASNEAWVVPASLDSRRFFVLEVADTKAGDHEYFGAIWQQMENGGYAAMLHDMLRHDITGFNVRRVPVTAGLQQQRKLSLPTTESWWREVLDRGYVLQSRCGVEGTLHRWHEGVSTDLLYSSYLDYARHHGEKHPMSRENLGRFMRKLKARPRKFTRVITGERRGTYIGEVVKLPDRYGYLLGGLAEAREDFTKMTGLPIVWNGADEFDGAGTGVEEEEGRAFWMRARGAGEEG
jgi:hypothetical protein